MTFLFAEDSEHYLDIPAARAYHGNRTVGVPSAQRQLEVR